MNLKVLVTILMVIFQINTKRTEIEVMPISTIFWCVCVRVYMYVFVYKEERKRPTKEAQMEAESDRPLCQTKSPLSDKISLLFFDYPQKIDICSHVITMG